MLGFGQTGPYAQMAGHDINYVALSGILLNYKTIYILDTFLHYLCFQDFFRYLVGEKTLRFLRKIC